MTAHLLLITLGPVQEFIAQARRTRDLWYGSHLLSELARAAARALVDGGAHLIFPALEQGDPELVPCLAPTRNGGKPPVNIANKLLAEVPAGVDASGLARTARSTVMEFWRKDIASPVKQSCGGLIAGGVEAVWEEQIDTFIEFAASWAPLGNYVGARRQVEQAIASRKNLRDFEPWTRQRGNVPKSSLDGARETVLRPPKQRDARLARKYRVTDGEQLDAVGLVKRAGGDPEQFVPVINVALASWTDLAARETPAELDALKMSCEKVDISRVLRSDLPCAAAFPFDASVLLQSRWESVFEEQGIEENSSSWGRNHVGPLIKRLTEPFPYVACLLADGDRMGQAIDRLVSANAHRAFSQALSTFAGDARNTIEQQHRGALIYSGGDDVLAFLPLPEALSCADDLRQCFSTVMAGACDNLPTTERPTLSVGLGVGHVMESMGDLLALGRAAEREAKRDRNALAVLVDKRSGGRRAWSGCWDKDPVGRLRTDAELQKARLSSRKIYEVARTLMRLPEPTDGNDPGWARLLALEVRRSLSRVGEGTLSPEEAGLSLDDNAGYAALHRNVRAWMDRMLIARTFAMAVPQVRRRQEEEAA